MNVPRKSKSSRISVSNKVRFGSTSQKGTKKKSELVQDREKDKDKCITWIPQYIARWCACWTTRWTLAAILYTIGLERARITLRKCFRYSIDNSLAERTLRPMTVERVMIVLQVSCLYNIVRLSDTGRADPRNCLCNLALSASGFLSCQYHPPRVCLTAALSDV